MSPVAFFLALTEDCWQVARIESGVVELGQFALDGPELSESRAQEIAASLAELGYDGQGICLGLPSYMVLSAQIDCENLPRKQRRTAMLYRLEEQLPLDAEALTADFLPPVGGRALGLAVETARVRALVGQLAQAGIQTAAVCPTSFLTLWGCCHNGSEPVDYTVIANGSTFEVFRQGERRPAAWYVVPGARAELIRCIEVDLLQNPTESDETSGVLVGEFDADVVKSLEENLPISFTRWTDERPVEAAARTAARVLTGESAGWVNFRRDELAMPNPWRRVAGLVNAAVILGLVLLSALAGTFYLRGRRYAEVARRCEQKQKAEYQMLYPNQPVPGNVRERLASELKRLAAVSGSGIEIPERANALEALRQVVANLPASVRLRIVQMQIGPGGIIIEGQARNHADAEVLSRSLKGGGVAMDPPRTERLPAGGVAFTLVGRTSAPGGPTP